jgi:hypothetical protein
MFPLGFGRPGIAYTLAAAPERSRAGFQPNVNGAEPLKWPYLCCPLRGWLVQSVCARRLECSELKYFSA